MSEPSVTDVAAAAGRYRALGEPVRLGMLHVLRERPRTVSQVASAVQTSVSTTSRHLAWLAREGLVARERRGRSLFCRLTHIGAAVLSESVLGGPVSADTETDTGSGSPEADSGLCNRDVEEVRFFLAMGVSLVPYGGPIRAAWDARMSDLFGREILPHLPVLHAASLRIRRGEPLDGLLIPEELIAEGPGAISYAQAR